MKYILKNWKQICVKMSIIFINQYSLILIRIVERIYNLKFNITLPYKAPDFALVYKSNSKKLHNSTHSQVLWFYIKLKLETSAWPQTVSSMVSQGLLSVTACQEAWPPATKVPPEPGVSIPSTGRARGNLCLDTSPGHGPLTTARS